DAPASFDEKLQFRNVKPALTDAAHPDHRLAAAIARAAMIRLPVLDRALFLQLLTAHLSDADLATRADARDVAGAVQRLFGAGASAESIPDLKLSPHATVRDAYAALLDTEAFRTACGRISASYAW